MTAKMKNNETKREYVAIFSHYDKDNIIDDYVVHYLDILKKFVSKIVFVSDGVIEEKYKQKISTICDDVICKEHGEYDFGSYKRGVQKIAGEISNYSDLILVNDSCFLVDDIHRIFLEMEKKENIDFWGLTENSADKSLNNYHLQSYFLVLRQSVFLSEIFIDFISSIKKQSNKEMIIKEYEVGLSYLLRKNGFKSVCYFPKDIVRMNSDQIEEYFYHKMSPHLLLRRMFFILKSLIINNYLNNQNYVCSFVLFPLLERRFPLVKKSLFNIQYSGAFAIGQWIISYLCMNLLKERESKKIVNHISSYCHRMKFNIVNKELSLSRFIMIFFCGILISDKKYLDCKKKEVVRCIRILIFKAKLRPSRRKIYVLGIKVFDH